MRSAPFKLQITHILALSTQRALRRVSCAWAFGARHPDGDVIQQLFHLEIYVERWLKARAYRHQLRWPLG
eukprot:4170790-Pyramimonas_sp.AAC.1